MILRPPSKSCNPPNSLLHLSLRGLSAACPQLGFGVLFLRREGQGKLLFDRAGGQDYVNLRLADSPRHKSPTLTTVLRFALPRSVLVA